MPDPNLGDGPLDASKARLADVLHDVGAKSLNYLYDFGDGWEHTARIERVTDAARLFNAGGWAELSPHCNTD